VKRYPHLIFYIESGDAIDVWRVLHAERAALSTRRGT